MLETVYKAKEILKDVVIETPIIKATHIEEYKNIIMLI